MIRRPPRSTLDRSSAASDVYKRQCVNNMVPILYSSNSTIVNGTSQLNTGFNPVLDDNGSAILQTLFYTNSGVTTYFTPLYLSLIHISEPTRPY